MTARLGNSPAAPQAFCNPNSNVDISSVRGPRPSLRLFANGVETPKIDAWEPDSTGGEAERLGNGGATLPVKESTDETETKSEDFKPERPLPENPTFQPSIAVSRWALHHRIRRLCRPDHPDERGPSVCGCGAPGYQVDDISIHVRHSDATGEAQASVAGVYRCDSPWLCPVCAPRKATERVEKVQGAAEATYARGGQVSLVVLTASHSDRTPLAEINELIKKSSSAARAGREWQRIKRDCGVLGVIVGQEVTYSMVNGWHYHQHLSVYVDGPTETEKAEADGDANRLNELVIIRAQDAADAIARRYKECIRRKGGKVDDRHGVMTAVAASAADASAYTAKGSAAWEIAGSSGKTETEAKSSLTPWDIAFRASEGDSEMAARWAEYVAVMPGTKTCVVSAKLSEALGLDKKTEESAGDGEEAEGALVGTVEAYTWKKWLRLGLVSTFLARVELYGEEDFDQAVERTEDDAGEIDRRLTAIAIKRQRVEDRAENERRVASQTKVINSITSEVRRLRGPGTRAHIGELIERAKERDIRLDITESDIVRALAQPNSSVSSPLLSIEEFAAIAFPDATLITEVAA